jgi:hypothetical protein
MTRIPGELEAPEKPQTKVSLEILPVLGKWHACATYGNLGVLVSLFLVPE